MQPTESPAAADCAAKLLVAADGLKESVGRATAGTNLIFSWTSPTTAVKMGPRQNSAERPD